MNDYMCVVLLACNVERRNIEILYIELSIGDFNNTAVIATESCVRILPFECGYSVNPQHWHMYPLPTTYRFPVPVICSSAKRLIVHPESPLLLYICPPLRFPHYVRLL
jgi:hypothetical protein